MEKILEETLNTINNVDSLKPEKLSWFPKSFRTYYQRYQKYTKCSFLEECDFWKRIWFGIKSNQQNFI